MIYLVIYFFALVFFVVIFYKKNWFRMDHRSLFVQPLFWASFAVPLASFVFFGYFSWLGHPIEISEFGLNNFLEISKVPLGLLSLAVPLSVIVANAHRAIQTESQIELVLQKNAVDRYYAHEKNFVEKIKSLDFGATKIFNVDGILDKIEIGAPYTLYKKLYKNSSINLNSEYSADPFFDFVIREKLKGANQGISEHLNNIEGKMTQMTVDEEINLVFATLLAAYEVFDHIGIGNISNNYFYTKSAKRGFQVNINSEDSFKTVLQILLEVSTSILDVISSKPLTDIDGIRRYAFSPHSYFFIFKDVSRVSDYRTSSWREVVNLFNG